MMAIQPTSTAKPMANKRHDNGRSPSHMKPVTGNVAMDTTFTQVAWRM